MLTANLIKTELDAIKEVMRGLPEVYKQEKRRMESGVNALEDTFKFIHQSQMQSKQWQMESEQRQMQSMKQQAGLIESLKKISTKLMADLSEQVHRLEVASARPSPTADPSATPATMANIEALVTNALISESHMEALKALEALVTNMVGPEATTETFEAALNNTVRRRIHFTLTGHISDEGAQNLKKLFASFRDQNMPIPRQLHDVAKEACTKEQLRWVMDEE